MGDDDDEEEKDCLVNTSRLGDRNEVDEVGAVESVMDTRLQKMEQDKILQILC